MQSGALLVNKASLAKPARTVCVELQRLELEEIPVLHPVHHVGEAYCRLLESCAEQHLPEFGELTNAVDAKSMDYCVLLAPVEAHPFIDFTVVERGTNVIGGVGSFRRGGLYSDQISSHLTANRLMELASCMSLKNCRFSAANSARPGLLNLRVFRAVLPVWIMKMQRHGIVLAIAPVYCESVK